MKAIKLLLLPESLVLTTLMWATLFANLTHTPYRDFLSNASLFFMLANLLILIAAVAFEEAVLGAADDLFWVLLASNPVALVLAWSSYYCRIAFEVCRGALSESCW